MSVFKRLGNVAKGKMMEIGKSLEDSLPTGEPDELDPDQPPPSRASSTSPTEEEKRDMLSRLKKEGLLTDEEYEEKMAALEPPSPSRPKKRRL